MGGFTPPTKIKKVISSDSDCKNSPIRMRLFRNRIVDYSLHVPNTAKKKKKKKTNSISVDGLQPKLKIIHEKSAMDSDSDCNAKKLQLSPRGSSEGKLRIIRENTVDSENDCKHE